MSGQIETTNTSPHRMVSLAVRVLLVACLFHLLSGDARAITGPKILHWEHSPYQLVIRLAIDAPGNQRHQIEELVDRHLSERALTSVGPIWQLDIQPADWQLRLAMLDNLENVTIEDAAGDIPSVDKLMLLVIQATGNGYHMQAKEFDGYTLLWSTIKRDDCAQYSMLGERAFRLVWDTFSPLAQLRLDPDEDDLVYLDPRASEVLVRDSSASWVHSGDVFLPLLRRETREGELLENGIQAVPWTHVVAEGVKDASLVGRVQSGTRRPLGVRRRGKIQQLALAIHGTREPVQLRVISRSNPDKPLVGYEVFSKPSKDSDLELVGLTDRQGFVNVPPQANVIQMIYLKNGGQLLARFPIVSGLQKVIDIPIPDDDPRLNAEAALNALREDLIDQVARRNILISRVRRAIEDGEHSQASKLIEELDDLPGRAQFDRELGKLRQRFHSPDRQIQQRIDRLFSATREVLGQFLDVQEINELREELNTAKVAQST